MKFIWLRSHNSARDCFCKAFCLQHVVSMAVTCITGELSGSHYRDNYDEFPTTVRDSFMAIELVSTNRSSTRF